jgi:hypothetical protein
VRAWCSRDAGPPHAFHAVRRLEQSAGSPAGQDRQVPPGASHRSPSSAAIAPRLTLFSNGALRRASRSRRRTVWRGVSAPRAIDRGSAVATPSAEETCPGARVLSARAALPVSTILVDEAGGHVAGRLAVANPPPHAELTKAPTLGAAFPARPSRLPLSPRYRDARVRGGWLLATAGEDRWAGKAHRGGGARCVSLAGQSGDHRSTSGVRRADLRQAGARVPANTLPSNTAQEVPAPALPASPLGCVRSKPVPGGALSPLRPGRRSA